MTPNDIMPDSQISALISNHQRGCLLKQMGTKIVTHSQTIAETEFGTHSSKGDVSIKSHPSDLKEPHRRGGRRSARDR